MQRVSSNIFLYRLPLDVLHHEIRPAIFEHAGVEQACNVRMNQAREDAPLAPKALPKITSAARLNYFDRDFRWKLVVVTNTEVDGSHAARSERAFDPIWAGRSRHGIRIADRQHRLVQALVESSGVTGICQQRFNLAPQPRVFDLLDREGPIGRVAIEQLVKQFFDPRPLRRHVTPPSCRVSQIRAVRNSRCTVAVEMPAALAASSIVIPPKKRISTMRA